VTRDLPLRLLEVFAALMRERTTVRAADALGISQPAVSSSLAALEAQLGFPLFERRNRRLVPTEEALSLHREIEPIFVMLGAVEARVRDLRAGSAGRLRIMATPPLGHTVAPVALRRFLAGRPQVSVDYDVRRAASVIEAVAFGAADVGLVLGMERRPDVQAEVIEEAAMVALAPAGHALAGAGRLGPADLAEAGFVGLQAGSRLGQLLRGAFAEAGATYAPRVEVRYAHTAAVLVEAGLGLAVVDRFTARFVDRRALTPVPFFPAISAPCLLLTRAEAPASLLGAAFAEEVRRAAREQGG
jgi:DNA-binding transcriptional LysR family regulator